MALLAKEISDIEYTIPNFTEESSILDEAELSFKNMYYLWSG